MVNLLEIAWKRPVLPKNSAYFYMEEHPSFEKGGDSNYRYYVLNHFYAI